MLPPRQGINSSLRFGNPPRVTDLDMRVHVPAVDVRLDSDVAVHAIDQDNVAIPVCCFHHFLQGFRFSFHTCFHC